MNDIINKINGLKTSRDAIILAHNYQRPEIQDIADYVGDSLGLSQTAAQSRAKVIVFCGVHFMAETAAIICPEKTVIMPDQHAGCPMANMITVRELRELKKQHPDALVVTYVNSSAAIKAESDYCCTSSNAVRVVQAMPKDKPIIFIPDQHLGNYVQTQVKRELILWRGYCPTHRRILASDIARKKTQYPNALVVVHPECSTEVVQMADKVASTSGILKYCQESPAKEFIIGTEIGILHRLKNENPGKTFIEASVLADCPNMKLNTLEKVLWSLEDIDRLLDPALCGQRAGELSADYTWQVSRSSNCQSMECKVTVAPDIASKALRAINRMLEIG